MKRDLTNSIDIDIGGTFTDCFLQSQGRRASAKSPTTHYNLSVGFLRALEEAALLLNLDLETLLPETEFVHYSTTLAMNKLLERSGPKLGLITTEGFEDFTLIGKGAQWVDGLSRRETRNLASVTKPEPLIPREHIIGIKERIDYRGKIIRPFSEEDLREKLPLLIDQGIRGIVVSLLWAHRNPAHEIRVREIIEEEYPETCLGYLPIILSHEVQPKKGEYERTMNAILNAYLRDSFNYDFGNIRQELRDKGYTKSILIVHNSGGLAALLKTTAIETYNAGPVAGIMGSLEIAKYYGFENVITTDMGGTSFDIGVISDGEPQFCETGSVVDRWLVTTPMIETKSIGAGGGSVARINETLGNVLEVGPHSAGSNPGPACYNLGGTDPTVTDADVFLGYINPKFFHGGRIQLEYDLASKAISDKIAKPLNVSTEEAAVRIRRLIDGNMGNMILKETMLKGRDPGEFILFSFGGAGPTHCCGYASGSQIRRLITFPFSPVFCAYSASLMDIHHIYELSRRLIVLHPAENDPVLDVEEFNHIVDLLVKEAVRGAKAEGLDHEKLVFVPELDMKYGGQLHVKRIRSPRLKIENHEHVSQLLRSFAEQYSKAFSPTGVYPEGGVSIENFIMHAVFPLKKIKLPRFPVSHSKPPALARKGWRMVYWEGEGRFENTPIYDHSSLRRGNIIEGPAVIEADYTTFVVPAGAIFRVDQYMNNVMERIAGGDSR